MGASVGLRAWWCLLWGERARWECVWCRRGERDRVSRVRSLSRRDLVLSAMFIFVRILWEVDV